MHRIVSSLLLLSLFTWNSLLGGFGGLFLCLHENGGSHLVADSGENHHEDECAHPTSAERIRETLKLGECTFCTDIPLTGPELESYLAERNIPVSSALFQRELHWEANFKNPSCKQMGAIKRPRGPPPLSDSSVEISECTVLII